MSTSLLDLLDEQVKLVDTKKILHPIQKQLAEAKEAVQVYQNQLAERDQRIVELESKINQDDAASSNLSENYWKQKYEEQCEVLQLLRQEREYLKKQFLVVKEKIYLVKQKEKDILELKSNRSDETASEELQRSRNLIKQLQDNISEMKTCDHDHDITIAALKEKIIELQTKEEKNYQMRSLHKDTILKFLVDENSREANIQALSKILQLSTEEQQMIRALYSKKKS